MALLDAYATATQYKDRVQHSSADDNAEIGEQLVAGARVLEYELGWAPGAFNQSAASTTRYFTAFHDTILWLNDEAGLVQPLVSVDADGIQVDEERDGTYSTQFDPTTETWAVLLPRNAAEVGKPYEAIELLPLTTNGTLTKWPAHSAAVRVKGTYGWPVVANSQLEVLTELNVFICRDMRDRLAAGAAGQFQMLDSGVVVRDDTWRTFMRAKSAFNRRPVGVA